MNWESRRRASSNVLTSRVVTRLVSGSMLCQTAVGLARFAEPGAEISRMRSSMGGPNLRSKWRATASYALQSKFARTFVTAHSS